MFCNSTFQFLIFLVSHKVPEDPVVSIKSGLLFEKSLILKYIKENGTCPITKESLEENDLIQVKTENISKPKSIGSNSIPGILQIFQSEWDSLMLETFTLKQQIHTLKQDLSRSLYEKDAACRVIARLIKEKDELKSQIVELSNRKEKEGEDQEEKQNFPQEMVDFFEEVAQKLSEKRRNREISSTLAPTQMISNYRLISSHPIHKTTPPGIRCVAVHSSKNLVLSGGEDSNVVLFNKDTDKILATLTGHTKPITQVLFSHDLIISSSQDKTAKFWKFDSNSSSYTHKTIQEHKDVVTGISSHPSGAIILTCSLDKTFSFHNTEGETIITNQGENGFTACQFHPDGVLVGIATDKDYSIEIWDITANEKIMVLKAHTGIIQSLSFSENGTLLASGSKDGTVRIWNLRKQTNIHTIDIGSPIQSVQFDYSGSYLAVGSSDVRIYQNKTWEELLKMKEHTDIVTGVSFSKDAQYLISSSMDRHLKCFSGTIKK